MYEPCVSMFDKTVIFTFRPSHTTVTPSSSVALTFRGHGLTMAMAGSMFIGSAVTVPFTDTSRARVIVITVADFRSSIVTLFRQVECRQRRLHSEFSADIRKFCSYTSCN